MQALGMRLEENGAALALRGGEDEPGTKWERVPESVLRKLDAGSRVRSDRGGLRRWNLVIPRRSRHIGIFLGDGSRHIPSLTAFGSTN